MDAGTTAVISGAPMKTLWTTLLNLTFAVWWGGLTFYSVFVVPMGTAQIGTTEQGFITQQVTWWHNMILVVMVVLLAIEAWRERHRWLWALVAILSIVATLLFFQHSKLTNLMDFEGHHVQGTFYGQHALYLWLTAAEWAVGIALVLLQVMNYSRHRTDTS